MDKAAALARRLAAGEALTDGELLTLLEQRTVESAEILRAAAVATARKTFGNQVYLRATTAASAAAIARRNDTVCLRRSFWPAATRAMTWGSEPLSCRAARMAGGPMTSYAIS